MAGLLSSPDLHARPGRRKDALSAVASSSAPPLAARIAPGLPALLRYDVRSDFRYDLIAGLALASVAVPAGIANAQLAGLDPVAGLYASILPPIAYALFGTSRQLVVGPDTATSAMVAAALLPLAAGDPAKYGAMSVTLALLTGLFCILARFLRLGALADFFSRPILIGFLNGVALSVLFSQASRLFGLSLTADGFFARCAEFLARLDQTHLPTLALGLGTFAMLALGRRFASALPAALIAMIVAGTAVALLQLQQQGVATLGAIEAGLPVLRMPELPLAQLPRLIIDAAGLTLVLFASGVLSARAFAEKNRYELDVDQEFAAFGAANLASAAMQGFCVSGSTSRTAVIDANGGRTQVAGIVGATGVLLVLLFLTEPLQYVPMAALSAILVYASFGIFDVATLRWIWRVDRIEVLLSILTTVGVVLVGPMDAIAVAVGLALMRFVKITARPRDEVLGEVPGLPGLHAVDRHPGAKTWDGILIYRFDGPITFFNSAYFRQRARRLALEAGPGLKWFVIDMVPISNVDVTGFYAIHALRDDLAQSGVQLVFAGRRTEIIEWLRSAGLYDDADETRLFSTLRQAIKAYRRQHSGQAAPTLED
jgi:high affinity sulfate transporter 1